MEICKEIKKIVEYQNMSLSITERRNESSLKQITESIQNDFNNGNYNFSKFTDIAVKQMGKVRHIKTYAPFSCEETLCIYLKRILDRKFSIKYPNRNEYIHSLFDMTNALRTMNDYSISIPSPSITSGQSQFPPSPLDLAEIITELPSIESDTFFPPTKFNSPESAVLLRISSPLT